MASLSVANWHLDWTLSTHDLNSQTRTGGDVNLDCSQACRLWSSRLGHGNYMAQSMADRQGVAPDYQTRNIQPITVCPSK